MQGASVGGGGSDCCAACQCRTHQPQVSTVTLHQATSELSPGWWGNTMYACMFTCKHICQWANTCADTQGDIREASPPHTSSRCQMNFSLSEQDVPLVFKSFFFFFPSDTLQINPWRSITKITQMCFNQVLNTKEMRKVIFFSYFACSNFREFSCLFHGYREITALKTYSSCLFVSSSKRFHVRLIFYTASKVPIWFPVINKIQPFTLKKNIINNICCLTSE